MPEEWEIITSEGRKFKIDPSSWLNRELSSSQSSSLSKKQGIAFFLIPAGAAVCLKLWWIRATEVSSVCSPYSLINVKSRSINKSFSKSTSFQFWESLFILLNFLFAKLPLPRSSLFSHTIPSKVLWTVSGAPLTLAPPNKKQGEHDPHVIRCPRNVA